MADNNLTPEQRMEQECERSLSQARQSMQIIDAVINHMMRPVKMRQPGTPWADCNSCHVSFSPVSDQCPECGSEAIKLEGEN